MTKDLTIKTECHCIQEHPKINKIFATIDAKNMAKLLDVVGLTANPREAKKNKITDAIRETLITSPEDMRFMSKGLLISTSKCIPRERGRFTLSLGKESYEGVLDGGHNILAIGLFILEKLFGDEPKGINSWDKFLEIWKRHRGEIENVLEDCSFEVPIEIIYPSNHTQDTDEGDDEFARSIFDISDARNNNCALTAGTKAHHRRHYEILKGVLEDDIKNAVEWRDGEGQRIRRDDVVAMSLIPLYALQEAGLLSPKSPVINPINLYSGKGKCVDIFSYFYGLYSKDGKEEISDETFLSAISLIADLPRLYDLIYKQFPESYNEHSPGFGRMKCVKKNENSHFSYSTKYYQMECDYKYPDGFIIPIFCGLSSLMEVNGKRLQWKVAPEDFITKNLTKGIQMLMNTIKDNGYNPNVVGKNKGAYEGIEFMFKYLLAT